MNANYNDPRKRILVLTSTFPRWKNDTVPPFVYNLSKKLTRDFDIYVLAPHSPGAKKFEIMENMKVHRFKYFWEQYENLTSFGGILPTLKKNRLFFFQVPFFIIAEFLSARELVKKIKPYLIHAHWIIPQGFIAVLLKKLYSIDFVVTSHGGDIFALRNKLFIFLKKVILREARKVTAVSNVIKNEILNTIDNRLTNKIKILPMGIDNKTFNPQKRNPALKKKYKIDGAFLLFVGRLVEKKGARYLVEAMNEVVVKHPLTKLLIIGDGPLKKELMSLIKERALDKNIIFVGPLPNRLLPQYYATADIFIAPSIITKEGDTEGLGLTLVEAGLSGCALIGSNIGGIPDVIQYGKNGFLVRQKDPDYISKYIIKMLNNPSLLLKMKKNSRKLLNNFSLENIGQAYKKILT